VLFEPDADLSGVALAKPERGVKNGNGKNAVISSESAEADESRQSVGRAVVVPYHRTHGPPLVLAGLRSG